MSYIFISYSRKDQGYAHKLAETLEKKGFSVWIDDRSMDYGDRWPKEIEKHVDGCGAFIVIMTPWSDQSKWVQNELTRANRKDKPIFPLLLEGEEPWLAVEAIQYVDVRGRKPPPPSFYDRLAKVVPRFEIGSTPQITKVPSSQPEAKLAPTKSPRTLSRQQSFEPELILIPAGEFLMGSDPRQDKIFVEANNTFAKN